MEKIHENINRFLPFGESLRQILQHREITKNDLKQLLRYKGVFFDDIRDEKTFPFILSSLLSPSEFDFLKEKLSVREDREKTITRTLNWESDVSLIKSIPNDFNIQEIIKTAFPKYKVMGMPTFKMEEKNSDFISLEFKCETENYSKTWFRAKSEFVGKISLEKIKTRDNEVQLQIIHTSPETTEISNKVVKHLENHFKRENFMNPKNLIEKIEFKDFTNEQRIYFFLAFTRGSDSLDFNKVLHIDIGPDATENLPENINWMELGKVKDLSINGDVIHEIPFIKDIKMRKYIELCEMDILYNFAFSNAEGNCRIKFGFPKYFLKRISSIEFVSDVTSINLKPEFKGGSKVQVGRRIMKEFDKLKTFNYDDVKQHFSI